MTHEGLARVLMVDNTEPFTSGMKPGVAFPCTRKRGPHGIGVNVPSALTPECLIEFSTEGDIQATVEADPGVLSLYYYQEIS